MQKIPQVVRETIVLVKKKCKSEQKFQIKFQANQNLPIRNAETNSTIDTANEVVPAKARRQRSRIDT